MDCVPILFTGIDTTWRVRQRGRCRENRRSSSLEARQYRCNRRLGHGEPKAFHGHPRLRAPNTIGVNPQNLTSCREQRSPTDARVDRCVRLYHPPVTITVESDRRTNCSSHGGWTLKPQGVAYRYHLITHLDIGGIPEGQRLKARITANPDHRQVPESIYTL